MSERASKLFFNICSGTCRTRSTCSFTNQLSRRMFLITEIHNFYLFSIFGNKKFAGFTSRGQFRADAVISPDKV
jgi:hypothetical protein